MSRVMNVATVNKSKSKRLISWKCLSYLKEKHQSNVVQINWCQDSRIDERRDRVVWIASDVTSLPAVQVRCNNTVILMEKNELPLNAVLPFLERRRFSCVCLHHSLD